MINIIKGHLNELFDREGDMSKERMAICKQCPLFAQHKVKGLICNPQLWLDPKTNTAIDHYEDGYTKGCGCRLEAKTRVEEAHCPASKW